MKGNTMKRTITALAIGGALFAVSLSGCTETHNEAWKWGYQNGDMAKNSYKLHGTPVQKTCAKITSWLPTPDDQHTPPWNPNDAYNGCLAGAK
jgi:hypothetical protein